MDHATSSKLTRYLLISHSFLWGITRENQTSTYSRLRRAYGLKFDDGSYSDATRRLVDVYGIDRLLEVASEEVQRHFSDKFIESMRGHWMRRERPTLETIDSLGVSDSVPLVETDALRTYAERWGEFAGIYFEEMASTRKHR